MTREEAKAFLTDISYDLGNMGVEYLTEKDGEKMRDAIKSLEQEPVYYPPCIDCNKKMDEIRNAYNNMITKALEQEPSGDNAVSRDVVKKQMIEYGFHAPDMTVTEFVEDLPPVNPKELFIIKPCVSSGVYEHDKQKALDNIRAELIQSIQNETLKIESGNEELFYILDKYEAEVKPQEKNELMTNKEIIEQLENTIGLIKQDGKDWLDDRDIPILEACIKSLTALDKIIAEIKQYQSDYDVHGTEYDRTAWKAFNRCLKTIDRHKGEVNPQESKEQHE